MTLGELNAKPLDGFVAAVGAAFEDSPWVAARTWERRPFATLDQLHEAMTTVVATASADEQLALLRAHPDLGKVRLKADTSVGSVRLQPDQMSEASAREQSGAGLDALTRDEYERLRALNSAYREKFGFPFLYAVKGSTKHDILNALERRLTSARDVERKEALTQVYRIARFRLEEIVRQP